MIPVLETSRLILRGFRGEDYPAHAAIWADPRTTAKFGAYAFDDENCWLRFQRNWGQWAIFGHGFWALEDQGQRDLYRRHGLLQRAPQPGRPLSRRAGSRLGAASRLSRPGPGARRRWAPVFAWGDAHIDAPQTWCMIAPHNLISQRTAARFGFRPGVDASYHGERVLTFLRPRGGQP